MYLLSYGLHSSSFVFPYVRSFQYTSLFISNGCCSGALVLFGLTKTTSRLSTTTSFSGLAREGMMMAARLWLVSGLVVIIRLFTDMDVFFITIRIHFTTMIEYEYIS